MKVENSRREKEIQYAEMKYDNLQQPNRPAYTV